MRFIFFRVLLIFYNKSFSLNEARQRNAHASLLWPMIISEEGERAVTPMGAEIIFRTDDGNTMKLSDA